MSIRYLDPASQENFSLIEISAADGVLLAQMAGHDKVHGFGAQDVDALLAYRIGGKEYAKTAFALTSDDGAQLRSVIFGFKTCQNIQHATDIPGNVHDILHQPAHTPLTGQSQAITFYSISSFTGGAGQMLINALLANHTDASLTTTLSPLRTLREAYTIDCGTLAPDECMALAALHLLEGDNATRNFHLGNGARIADIKLHANTPDSEDGRDGLGMMVNYLYTPDADKRKANRAAFKGAVAADGDRAGIASLMDADLRERLRAMPETVYNVARRVGADMRLARLICQ